MPMIGIYLLLDYLISIIENSGEKEIHCDELHKLSVMDFLMRNLLKECRQRIFDDVSMAMFSRYFGKYFFRN